MTEHKSIEGLKKEFYEKFTSENPENVNEDTHEPFIDYWRTQEIWEWVEPHLNSRNLLERLIAYAEDDFRKEEAKYHARGEFVTLDYSPNIWLKKLIDEFIESEGLK